MPRSDTHTHSRVNATTPGRTHFLSQGSEIQSSSSRTSKERFPKEQLIYTHSLRIRIDILELKRRVWTRLQWGVSVDVQGVTAEFLQNPTVKTICTTLGWERDTTQMCEERWTQTRESGGELRALWTSESQKTFHFPHKINLRFYEQDPSYILQRKVLAQPRRCAWCIMCQKKKKCSFKKGSTDCPLQNDYCTYSCITMF